MRAQPNVLLLLLLGQLLPQRDDLALHLGVALALADALEVDVDAAVEVAATTARAWFEGVLDDVAFQLETGSAETIEGLGRRSHLLLAALVAGALLGLLLDA